MKKRQKKKHCHGLTRNFTEKTEAKTRKEAEAAEALATVRKTSRSKG